MTSLAQLIVDAKPAAFTTFGRKHWEDGKAVFEIVQRSLKPIDSTSDELEIKCKALRFIFTDDAPTVTSDAIRMKQLDASIPFVTARLPATSTWIEWRLKNACDMNGTMIEGTTYIGILLQSDDDARSRMKELYGDKYGIMGMCMMKYPGYDAPFPAFAFYLPDMPLTDPKGVLAGLRWTASGLSADDEAREVLDSVVRDTIYALFLITTPRVCEIRDVVFPLAKQKARAKAGKSPLIEYKQMILRIGVGHVRYRSNGSAGSSDDMYPSKRKFHPVIGHWRTYTEGRDVPKVSFVPEHWRGDPEKGIIIHERIVKR